LLFYNSLKMKMSVILGVSQMTLGIFMKLLNAIYFNHGLDIAYEFLPQILFLFSTFGYMCILIFTKWTIGNHKSPLILIVLINMFLPSNEVKNQTHYVYDMNTEIKIETILVILAFVCVPTMLIPKPLTIYFQWKNKLKNIHHGINEHDNTIEGVHVDEFKFSDVVVHQILETIEFVLGTLSHTASYLRLWALSLAHSELATVFWDMLFAPAMAFSFVLQPFQNFSMLLKGIISFFGAFFGFFAWFIITIGVILLMESLSAFLHALRLHWVEFQSKFYKGDGVKFVPLSYTKLLVGVDMEEYE